jgi:cytochrome c-type biogenesis protein CcmH
MRAGLSAFPPPSLRDRGGYGAALIGALLLILLATLTPTFAVTPDEMLKDPALEARARTLSEELRCMVCQNESIDDSDAALAHDIRVLLRERLAAGDSDRQVIDFLVARYGEFILLKPRFNWHTALLWAAPPAVLVIGGIVALGLFRRRRPGETVALSAAERARVEELMARRE